MFTIKHSVRILHNEQLQMLINQGSKIMSALETLAAQVAANTTVTEGAITLLNGLKERLDAAIASSSTDDSAALNALSEQLGNETAKLADAVHVNTIPDPANPGSVINPPVTVTVPNTSGDPAVSTSTSTTGT